MYDHHINNMTNRIRKRLGLSVDAGEQVRDELYDYWEDKIAVVWCVEDVLGLAEQEELDTSREQAIEVLDYIHEHLDASQGITWDNIERAIEELKNETS